MEPKFTTYDPQSAGTKGLVFIGDKILTYRRDTNTTNHPLEVDLPGGGPEGTETPFQNFAREVKEEFDLAILPGHITDTHTYPSKISPGKTAYFFVARLPAEAADTITFGDEGLNYVLETPADYLARTDAWKYVRDQARRYLEP